MSRILFDGSVLSPAYLFFLAGRLTCIRSNLKFVITEWTCIEPRLRTLPESNCFGNSFDGGYFLSSDDSSVGSSSDVTNPMIWECKIPCHLRHSSESCSWSCVESEFTYRSYTIGANEEVDFISEAVLKFQKERS